MEGTQPWPHLGLSCLNAHTLRLGPGKSLCLSPPAPAWSQAALGHLHTCTCAFLAHSTSGQSCCALLGECLGLQNLSGDSSKHQGLAKSHLVTSCARRAWAAAPPEEVTCHSLILGPEPNSAPLVTPGSGTVSPVPLAFLGSFRFLPAT